MSSNFLRVKQLRSCPYISFKYLNLLVMINQFINIIIAIALLIELYQTYALYVYGYLIVELAGLGIAYLAFRLSANLLTMGRTKRKWTLWMLYWV